MSDEPPHFKTGICIYDHHYPHHHPLLWENILKLITVLRPDYFVLGGDNLNMDSVDHWLHDTGDRRHLEGRRLKKEYDGYQREILDPLEKALPKYCRKLWLNGNHEGWLDRYVDKIPELEGLLEIKKNLKLDDWEFYDYGKTAKIGKLYFVHGEYTNKYAAAKTVDAFYRNIIIGHGHTYQTYTHISPIDAEAYTCTEMPCACTLNPDYMKNRPSTWVNGFGVFYIQDNGTPHVYPVIASKGHFIFEGRYY